MHCFVFFVLAKIICLIISDIGKQFCMFFLFCDVNTKKSSIHRPVFVSFANWSTSKLCNTKLFIIEVCLCVIWLPCKTFRPTQIFFPSRKSYSTVFVFCFFSTLRLSCIRSTTFRKERIAVKKYLWPKTCFFCLKLYENVQGVSESSHEFPLEFSTFSFLQLKDLCVQSGVRYRFIYGGK